MNTHSQKTSALVLSGGWALGVAHLGAVAALLEQGYVFDWYAGVSAGAIITAGLALGKSPTELRDIILETKLLSLAFDFTWKKWGLLSGSKVTAVLTEIFGEATFRDLATPLQICATNYENGERLIIKTGKIIDAVQASLSIPLLFTPFYHPDLGIYCVDGWLSHNFPVDLAVREYTGDCITGIDVNTSLASPLAEDKSLLKVSVTENMQRVFKIFFRNQSIPDDPRVRLIRPDLTDFTSFDIFKLEGMYQKWYESVLWSK